MPEALKRREPSAHALHPARSVADVRAGQAAQVAQVLDCMRNARKAWKTTPKQSGRLLPTSCAAQHRDHLLLVVVLRKSCR